MFVTFEMEDGSPVDVMIANIETITDNDDGTISVSFVSGQCRVFKKPENKEDEENSGLN